MKKSIRNLYSGINYFILSISMLVVFISCVKSENLFIDGDIKITEKEFLLTLDKLPDDIRDNILKDKKTFISRLSEVLSLEKADGKENQLFFPADKKNLLNADFEPSDLLPLDKEGFLLNKEGMKIRKAVMTDLKEMISDASEAGLKIVISSAYRSYSYQKNLYNYYIGIYGEEETARFSAPPGASQHQLGTSMDFGSITKDFMDTDEGKWIKENSWKYGFSLSYPEGHENITGYEFEPWHYRYITKPGAALERDFFGGLQYLFIEYLTDNREMLLSKKTN